MAPKYNYLKGHINIEQLSSVKTYLYKAIYNNGVVKQDFIYFTIVQLQTGI